ncbi:hypothetical protein M5K25_005908 [Dendrobium thyrsiflorum]|uniref:Uncharacterized protein n=1 Tax=Dendrobium thyrsiflorum TaxID=117978 RepID=A0ABD0VAD1_DENTH
MVCEDEYLSCPIDKTSQIMGLMNSYSRNLFPCAEILRFANGCHLCNVSVCLKEMPLATDETCVILVFS